MSTTFDAVATLIGPPLHSWLFHSATPATEDDVGSDPDSDFATGAGTYGAQVTGPLQDGTISYAVEFTDGRIDRGAGLTSNDWGSTTVGSITWWFRTSSPTQQIMWASHPSGKAFLTLLETDGRIRFDVIDDADGTTITTNNSVDYSDDQWHFVALTCDGASPNKLYVDGALVSVAQTTAGAGLGSFPWIGSLDDASTSNFRVGNSTRAPGSTNLPFVGRFSRLAFWAGVLSASEVDELWQAAFGVEGLPPGTPRDPLPITLPMTDSAYMAQRLAYRKLLEGQRQRFLSLIVNLRAIQWTVGDVLTVTLPDLNINAETFRITSWRSTRDPGRFELGLIADDAAAYADPIPAQYVELPTPVEPEPGAVQVPPPTALAATPTLEGIQLSWTAPDNLLAVHHYAIYSDTDSSWAGATLIGTTLSTTFLHALATTGARWYWVRAVNSGGSESIRSPDSDTGTVTATFTAGTTAVPSAPQTLGGIDGTPVSGNLTGSFTRAGVTVASRVFTATHAAGNLTYTAGADSGEATTHSATGSGTPTLVVTHRHTGSGQTTTLTFTVAP